MSDRHESRYLSISLLDLVVVFAASSVSVVLDYTDDSYRSGRGDGMWAELHRAKIN